MKTSTQPVQRALFSDVELADYLGVSVAWLRKKRITGGGPTWRKLGTLVRYHINDVHEYLDACPRGGGRAQ
jgi:hypothetical protein